jgi:hypothetical protein
LASSKTGRRKHDLNRELQHTGRLTVPLLLRGERQHPFKLEAVFPFAL